MEHYRNLGGNSGVIGYEIGETDIKVQFSDNSVYLYTNGSAGNFNIQKMKRVSCKWKRIE